MSWAAERRRAVWKACVSHRCGTIETVVLQSLVEVGRPEQWPVVWRRREDIASDTGLSVKQVSNAIDRLVHHGLLVLISPGHRGRGDVGVASVYRVTVKWDQNSEKGTCAQVPIPEKGTCAQVPIPGKGTSLTRTPRDKEQEMLKTNSGSGTSKEEESVSPLSESEAECFTRLLSWSHQDGVPPQDEATARMLFAKLIRSGHRTAEGIAAPRVGEYVKATDAIMMRNNGDRAAIKRYLKGRSLDGWLTSLLT